jgi:hypothetical protein
MAGPNIPLGTAFVTIGLRGSLQRQLERERQLAERATRLLQDRISEFTAASARIFLTGAAAITGFVASASPDAINTFTGSIRLLSGEIGRAFIPAFTKAIAVIQGARNYIRGMSDETKENIVKWNLWVLGITGAIFVASKLIAVLMGLVPVIKLIGSALLLLGAHPAIAGILLLATAVGVLAVKLAGLRAEAEAYQKTKTTSATVQQVAEDKEVKGILGSSKTTDEKKRLIQERIGLLEQEKEQARAELKGTLGRDPVNVVKSLLTGFAAQEVAKDKVVALQKRIQTFKGARDILEGKQLPSEKKDKIVTSISGPTPQFLAIDQISKSFQLAALQSPIEAEKLAMEIQNNSYFQQTAANTAVIAQSLPVLNLGAGR